jgi:hypothetical protein
MTKCNHQFVQTGAMLANESRCIHCGEWKDKPAPDVQELVEALRDLLDEQNGPPLLRYEKQWQAAVDAARAALAKWEGK